MTQNQNKVREISSDTPLVNSIRVLPGVKEKIYSTPHKVLNIWMDDRHPSLYVVWPGQSKINVFCFGCRIEVCQNQVKWPARGLQDQQDSFKDERKRNFQ